MGSGKAGVTTAAYWSPNDLRILRELRLAGYTNRQIAQTLDRSPRAVEHKAKALKIPSKHAPTPRQLYQQRRQQRRATTQTDIPRAGPTTLPPLPSLLEPMHIIQP